ncbi:MAG TPA: hypothetical protein VNA89_04265 [Gemmatimonadaceae bacterium]|nr:hypothetical protein [Gemmatimonadaceae bacterium]
MAPRSPKSLRHEYQLHVEEQIENYKDNVPRSVLLALGDEAVAALAAHQQLALTELLLCEEVDRLIRRRLRIPSYDSWRRRKLKQLVELQRPEHWGLRPDDVVVRTVRPSADCRVLVAEAEVDGPALYLAAHGCEVTAIDGQVDAVQRVLDAASQVGLIGRVRGCVADLGTWTPDVPLSAVIYPVSALAGMSSGERARVITSLQDATSAGGVHLIATAKLPTQPVPIDELADRYAGWRLSMEGETGRSSLLARKELV